MNKQKIYSKTWVEIFWVGIFGGEFTGEGGEEGWGGV